jgi:hypothetical protein
MNFEKDFLGFDFEKCGLERGFIFYRGRVKFGLK